MVGTSRVNLCVVRGSLNVVASVDGWICSLESPSIGQGVHCSRHLITPYPHPNVFLPTILPELPVYTAQTHTHSQDTGCGRSMNLHQLSTGRNPEWWEPVRPAADGIPRFDYVPLQPSSGWTAAHRNRTDFVRSSSRVCGNGRSDETRHIKFDSLATIKDSARGLSGQFQLSEENRARLRDRWSPAPDE